MTRVRHPGSVSYTHSDAADERSSVDLGGRRILKKKKKIIKNITVSIHTIRVKQLINMQTEK